MCDPDEVACQLKQLVAATTGWDWNSFTATLVATLAGAAIGVLSVWLSYLWQSKHRYRELLDESVVRIIEQVGIFAHELWQYRLQTLEAKIFGPREAEKRARKRGEIHLDRPNSGGLTVALGIAQLRARGKDREIIEMVKDIHVISRRVEPEDRARFLAQAASALVGWRSGRWPAKKARKAIQSVAAKLPKVSDPYDLPETQDYSGFEGN